MTTKPTFEGLLGGRRPSITPAQLVSGIPVIVALLAAFGVWTPTGEQQAALTAAVGWAAALVLGDAGLRAARGYSAAKVEAAEIVTETMPSPPPAGTTYQKFPDH